MEEHQICSNSLLSNPFPSCYSRKTIFPNIFRHLLSFSQQARPINSGPKTRPTHYFRTYWIHGFTNDLYSCGNQFKLYLNLHSRRNSSTSSTKFGKLNYSTQTQNSLHQSSKRHRQMGTKETRQDNHQTTKH